MEQNKILNKQHPATQQQVRVVVQNAFRSPTTIYEGVRNSDTAKFMQKMVQDKTSNVPDFVKSLMKTVLSSTDAGKMVRELEKSKSKSK